MAKKINMGKKFPLRHTLRPHISDGLFCGFVSLGFFALPLSYIADQGMDKLNWATVLLMGIGFLMLYPTLVALTTVYRIRIHDSRVTFFQRRLHKSNQEEVPLSEYTALVTMTFKETGFIGERDVHAVILWHKIDPMKQVSLFTTNSQKKLSERVALYEQLFHLPLNPSGLDLVEIPHGMPLEGFHKGCQKCQAPS